MKTIANTYEPEWELILFGTMKKIRVNLKLILIILFSGIGLASFSQGEDEDIDSARSEKVEQLKIAYFTKELSLTSAEAEKFWPIYNEMDAKLKANRKIRRKNVQELKTKREQLSDEEIKKKVNTLLDNESSETAIKKEYFEKIAGAIGYKKTAKLINLEQEFKRELLKRLNEGKNPAGHGAGKGPGPGQKPMR